MRFFASSEIWVEAQAPKYPDEQVACECGKQAQYVRQREAVSITLHGKIRYRRAYYVCECGQRQCPLDKRLGIAPGQMSAELQTMAAFLIKLKKLTVVPCIKDNLD